MEIDYKPQEWNGDYRSGYEINLAELQAKIDEVVRMAAQYPAAQGLTDRYGTPLFQPGQSLRIAPTTRTPKAAFELTNGWQRTINGFAARDTSSFVHEAAHGFLYDLYDASHVSKQALADVGCTRDPAQGGRSGDGVSLQSGDDEHRRDDRYERCAALCG